MDNIATRMRNLHQFKDASTAELEAVVAATTRPMVADVLGHKIRAAGICITLANGHSFDATSTRGDTVGVWAEVGETDLRFIPWSAISTVRFWNSRPIGRRGKR